MSDARGLGQSNQPDDEVTLVVNGQAWAGWTDVRVTRGVERMPSDFEVKLTEFAPTGDSIKIVRGDAVEIKFGADLVLTGYVDRVMRGYDARMHTVSILGRSKACDLVDCSAEWPKGQINGTDVLDIAQKLATTATQGHVSVSVTPGTAMPPIPQFNLNRGETVFEIVERLCRFSQLLAYDTPEGNLLLTGLLDQQAASGFAEGVNVLRAGVSSTMDQRYSVYLSYLQSLSVYEDTGGTGSDLISTVEDKNIPRYRLKVLIAEIGGQVGVELAQKRAEWEMARRQGRSQQVNLTADSWRDSAGVLFAPNTQAHVVLPGLNIPSANLTIGEVTYHRNETGTTCDLVLMPASAYQVQPIALNASNPVRELTPMAAAPGAAQ